MIVSCIADLSKEWINITQNSLAYLHTDMCTFFISENLPSSRQSRNLSLHQDMHVVYTLME